MTVNNEKFEIPLLLRFVEFETPYEMIIGLNDTMRYGLVNTLIVESSARHTANLQSYIHSPPLIKRLAL